MDYYVESARYGFPLYKVPSGLVSNAKDARVLVAVKLGVSPSELRVLVENERPSAERYAYAV